MQTESVKLFLFSNLHKFVYCDVEGYNNRTFSYRGKIVKIEPDGTVILQKVNSSYVSFKAEKISKIATLEEGE
jgi:hypothetical protein